MSSLLRMFIGTQVFPAYTTFVFADIFCSEIELHFVPKSTGVSDGFLRAFRS